MKEQTPNGYIIWENAEVVAISTGHNERSLNAKTGELIQVWILVKEMRPWEAVVQGKDAKVCFTCKHMGKIVDGKLQDRTCYVMPFQAPTAIWESWKAGNYPKLTDYSIFDDTLVRFGAYGEPVLIDIAIVREIVRRCEGHTGYTHRWADPQVKDYQQFFMASAEPENYLEAEANGWRVFVVRDYLSKPLPGLAICPASEEYRNRFKIGEYKVGRSKTALYSKPLINCQDCLLCSGQTINARGIQIENHSQIGKALAKRAAAVLARAAA